MKGSIAAILVRCYQLTLSSLVGPCCRFQPTCSEYSKEAFRLHGYVKGAILTAYRLLRCHPWAKGGYDPVPQVFTLKGRK